MPCKTPHQSTTSVIIVSVTLTFPVCSCMMKLKRCWINHHNLSRWTPRSLDTSVSFLNTSHPPIRHRETRFSEHGGRGSQAAAGGEEASAYRNTETSPWTSGEQFTKKHLQTVNQVNRSASHGPNVHTDLRVHKERSESNAVYTLRAPDALLHWCLYISTPSQYFKRSRKHYKEFSDCFGFSVNDLTMNSGLPELKERAKHWLHLYYLFFCFVRVCVWIFFMTSRQSEFSVLGKKHYLWYWTLSVTHLSLEICHPRTVSEMLS